MKKQKIKKLIAFTLVTGALVGSTSYSTFAMNTNNKNNCSQESKEISIKNLESKLDKEREDFYKLQNDKMALEKKQKANGKLEWEKEAKKNIDLDNKLITSYENEVEDIYNAETTVKKLLKEADEILRGLDKTNVTQEEISESFKKTDIAIKLAKKYEDLMRANFKDNTSNFVKASTLVIDAERKIYSIERLKEESERYAKEQLALRMEENRIKDEAFITLQKVMSELKDANFNMSQDKINSIIFSAHRATSKANAYRNIVKTDSNASGDLVNNSEKALKDANEQLKLANRLKSISQLILNSKNLSSRRDVRNFCTRLEEVSSQDLDKKSKIAIDNIKKEYIKYLEKFCNNAKSYEDGLQLATNINDFITVIKDDNTKVEAINLALNCINNQFGKLKNQHGKMDAEFVKGLSKSLHNLSEDKVTTKLLDVSLKLYEELGNRINKQIYFVNKDNKEVIESIIKNLKDGKDTENKLFVLGVKLEKDFNYASKPWLVQRIGTGAINAYQDINKTGLEVYNTGKNVYEAVIEGYEAREDIKTIIEDGVSFESLIEGKIFEIINPVKKEVEVKNPTFIETVKNKFNSITKTCSNALEVTKKVWSVNDTLNGYFVEKHTSVLSPITNKISNFCASINRSANATKVMVKSSQAYVTMKNTAITLKNTTSAIANKISNLFGF